MKLSKEEKAAQKAAFHALRKKKKAEYIWNYGKWQILPVPGHTRVNENGEVVVDRSNGGIGASFTVRKISSGVGVQRTFPVHSPIIEEIEVVRRGRVRRAKLSYLKGLSAKNARIKEDRR